MGKVKYFYKARCFYTVEGEIELEKTASTNVMFSMIREKHNIPKELGIDISIKTEGYDEATKKSRSEAIKFSKRTDKDEISP